MKWWPNRRGILWMVGVLVLGAGALWWLGAATSATDRAELMADLRQRLAQEWRHWRHADMDSHLSLTAVSKAWQSRQAERFVSSNMPRRQSESLRQVRVSSTDALIKAIRDARPGDEIRLVDGHYHFSGKSIPIVNAGAPGLPIVVRAERPWQAQLSFNLLEGFWVTAPYWHFQGLSIQGACRRDRRCEHAFHIVGEARHTRLQGNRITDFNAPVKINGSLGNFPDAGVIVNNSFINTRSRKEQAPVVMIDAVAVSQWRVEHNFIGNFLKDAGNRVSYGAFFKGGGSDNRIANNLVVCASDVQEHYTQVGISLGGGGTSKTACRDSDCAIEQSHSEVVGNLVMNCSDVGVYLNRAAESLIINNTLYATLGIDVRFPTSSAVLVNNVYHGKIRSRDQGDLMLRSHNLALSSGWAGWLGTTFGDLYNAPERLDFSTYPNEKSRLAGMDNSYQQQDICGHPADRSSPYKGAVDPEGGVQCFHY